MKRNLKKVVALLMSLVMLMCVTGVGAAAQEEKLFYLVLGDSIAYGSGITNSVAACYGKIVADTNDFEYANNSVPGYTTTNLINQLEQEQVIENVEKADIISISIGGNDFLMSNLTQLMFDALVKSDYSQFDAIAEKFYNNFTVIVEKINSVNPDAVILMQTLYNPQSGDVREVYQHGADRINAAVAKFDAENPGEIVVVDVATALSDTMDNFADDKIHPSATGNEKIAVAVNDTINMLGMGTGKEITVNVKGVDFELSPSFGNMLDTMCKFFRVLGIFYNIINTFFSSLDNSFA